MKRLAGIKRQSCFDPDFPESRPTPAQEEFLRDITKYQHRYLIGGNQSGKSLSGAREAAWVFSETHPYWSRPADWGNSPLTMIIVGRTTSQIEEELWAKKIKPMLDPSDYKEVRVAGQLSKVKHTKTGNVMMFFSHHSPNEAREKIQSYVAHWLWLDEMPNSVKLVEELHRRCQAKQGRFIATFTPKIRNNEIRRMVDQTTPYQKKYRIGMLDNPIYAGREEAILAPLASLTKEYRATVLHGEWYLGDTAVYNFDSERHVARPDLAYSPAWRHLESVDPAASGKAGYILLAEDPANHVWHVIRADYIQGASARGLLEEIQKRSGTVNVVRRISDPHEVWFIKHAAEEGLTYSGVFKKTERKKELIKNLQESLDNRSIVIAPWCEDLINEFSSCQWSETADDKIVGATRFHLLDALQYAVDNRPKAAQHAPPQSFDQWLKQENQKRKKTEAIRSQNKNMWIRRRR
jgi:phage terminase large subunit-like protein